MPSPVALSHTRMWSLNCAFQFQHRYLRPYTERVSEPAEIGRIAHGIVAEYIPELVELRRRSNFDALCAIFERHTKDVPERYLEPLNLVTNNFYYGFKLDKSCKHSTELILAVTRDYKPIEVEVGSDGHVVNLTQDVVTGRLDYLQIHKKGKLAFVWDWKMGQEHVHYDTAQHHPQLLLYAALVFWTMPEIEEVEVVLWGVKYGKANISRYRYTRDFACAGAAKRIEWGFAKLEALERLIGDDPWPAEPTVFGTCRFCPVAAQCPHNLAVLERVMSAPPMKVKRRPKVKAA